MLFLQDAPLCTPTPTPTPTPNGATRLEPIILKGWPWKVFRYHSTKSKYLQKQTGWCRKTCGDHPGILHGFIDTKHFVFFSWNGLGKPFRTIQNLMLMHKLIGFIAFFFYSLVQNLSTQSLVTAVSSGWNRFADTSRIRTRRSRISSPWISRGTNLDNSGSTRGSNPGTVCHPPWCR